MDIDNKLSTDEPRLYTIPTAGNIDVLQWEPLKNQRTRWALDEICSDCQSDEYVNGKKYNFRPYAVKKGWRFKSEKFLSLKFECYLYRGWHLFEECLDWDNYRQSYEDRSPWRSNNGRSNRTDDYDDDMPF